MVHFFYSYASWITVPSSHAPIPHAREREADGNGFMWYKLWEQWNSGIATPRPQACAQVKRLSVAWLNSLASMDKQYYTLHGVQHYVSN